MSKMIERVADAIAKVEASPRRTWHVDQARAAIEAMREPTLEMINAARWEDGTHTAGVVWMEMIDEALK